jgi:hypothetical protein
MKDSYLGIADQYGLRTLVPETEHGGSFLVRRAQRMNAVCFWVVIDRLYVDAVLAELERGEADNSLQMLQLLADEIGSLLPSTYQRAR